MLLGMLTLSSRRAEMALSCALVMFSACVASATLVRRWDAHANFHSSSSHHTFVLKYDSTRQGHTVAAAAFEAAVAHSAHQSPWQSVSVDAGTFDVATDENCGWLRAQIPAHAADIASGDPVMFYFHRQRTSWHKYLTMTQDGMTRFIAKKLSRAADAKPTNAASVLVQPKQHSVELTLANLFAASRAFSRVHHLARTIEHDLADAQRDSSLILGDAQQWADDVAMHPLGHRFANQTRVLAKLVQSTIAKSAVSTFNEHQRLSRLLFPESGRVSLGASQHADMSQRFELLRNFRESVPQTVHFVKTDARRDNFHMVAFLAMRSASHHIRPKLIKFWCVEEPTGPLWQRMKADTPELVVEIGEPPRSLNGVPLRLAAHQSDAWRLEILIREGGIYLDWDVLVLKSFDELLQQSVVFGAEKKVANYDEALGVAVIIARPQEPFLIRWDREMKASFSDSCYACHSIILSRRLALAHPHELLVLDHHSFYHPGWEESAAALLFKPLQSSADATAFENSFAIHLFESNKFMVPYVEKLTEKHIKTVDTNFNLLVRKYFD